MHKHVIKKTTNFGKCRSFAPGLSNYSQEYSNQLKHNDHVLRLFALGPLQIRIPDYAHAQILAITNH